MVFVSVDIQSNSVRSSCILFKQYRSKSTQKCTNNIEVPYYITLKYSVLSCKKCLHSFVTRSRLGKCNGIIPYKYNV